MKRIAILASGAGTNLENLLKRIKEDKLSCTCVLAFSDVPGAPCLDRARKYHAPVVSFAAKAFPDKHTFESRLMDVIDENEVDYIFLAGYMRILSKRFIKKYPWRIINIHPSYLPAFKGAHAIKDAFEARAEKTGVTVHFATEAVDGGPVIAQREVLIAPDDTLETLEEKVHAVEYVLYPEVLKMVVEGRVTVDETGRVTVNA